MEAALQPESTSSHAIKPYRRKIWVTVLLNILNSGLPLIYGGNLKGGIILTGFFLLIDPISMPLLGISFIAMVVGAVVQLLIWIAVLIYNISYTSKANRIGYPHLRRTWGWIIGLLSASLIISGAVNLLMEHYFVEAYKMPASSMANTLLIGDYLMAAKGIDTSALQREDIIIFKFPGDTRQNYIKRIAAMGGDRDKIVDKQLCVNDQLTPLRLKQSSLILLI